MPEYKLSFNDGTTNIIVASDENFAKNLVNGKGTYELMPPVTIPLRQTARIWRDQELAATDNISQTPDFPNRDKYLTYRQKLRDWPSTADFPAKKPALE